MNKNQKSKNIDSKIEKLKELSEKEENKTPSEKLKLSPIKKVYTPILGLLSFGNQTIDSTKLPLP